MAIHISNASKSNTTYNGKITIFVIASCIMAGMGGVIFGYDIGISGGVTAMEAFLEKFFPDVYVKMRKDSGVSNYCKFDSQLLTAFTSSLYIAGLFATVVASTVTRRFGRRKTMLLGGASFLVGAALGGAAVDVYMLIFGRVLLGVGVGFANQSVPLYLSEMAPPKYRGAFSNGFQFSISIGALAANFINYGTQKIRGGWGWRVSLALAAFPASVLTLGALFLPETPISLIQQGQQLPKAKALLQKIRGSNHVEEELQDMITAANNNNASQNHQQFRRILHPRYRPQLTMAVLIPFFQQVTGINVIAFYAPVLFRTIGIGESASLLSSVVTGVIGALSTLISMFIADKLGRRTLFLVGGVQMIVSQVLVGGILAGKLGDYGGVSKDYAYVIILLICIYVAGFGWSWGPLGWLVPSEIYPLEIRSAGQSITVGVSFVFTIVVAQSSLSMLCHMKSGIFFFYGAWLIVMTLFTFFFLPETKGVPMEKMVEVWKGHWFWKRFIDNGKLSEEYKVENAVL